jgi:telomerase reverse transcriptase
MSNPGRLGSSLRSIGDMYGRLKQFKTQISDYKSLYFAKLDVQAAFDTIPQSAVLRLMYTLLTESEYRINKHCELKPGENYREDTKTKPMRKFTAIAKPRDDFNTFEENLELELAVGKKNTIFVENIVAQFRDREEILKLLAQHVQQNMVKIGKKFYRQKEGIAQGSVVSSLLCNYFYADLEAQHLDFLKSGKSLLLRQTDDFLLVTTEKAHAKQFLQIMHDGLPAYGVQVNPDKTLVNFEVTINGKKVPRLVEKQGFPFCGSFIDTKTLNFSRDRERRKDIGSSEPFSLISEMNAGVLTKKKAIADSLTVEFSRVPGKTFHRKVLSEFFRKLILVF